MTEMPMVRMTAAFAGSNLTRSAIAFVTSIVIARGLGPFEFGRWTFLTAWASALTMAFDLGLSALVTRDAARIDRAAGGLVAGALAARLAIFAPVGIAICVAASWIDGVASTSAIRAVVWLAAAGMAYGCLGALFRAWPKWLGAILTIEAAGAAVQCAGAVWIVGRGGSVIDLLRFAVVVQVLQLVAALVLWRRAAGSDRLKWPSWHVGGALIRRAWPFALSGIVANLQERIAPLMLGHLSIPAEVGSFGVAARLSGAARVLPHSGFAAALPLFTHGAATGNPERFRHRFDRLLGWFAIAAAVCLIALAAPIVTLTYGSRFSSAAPALRWLAIGLVPLLVNSGRKVYLYASGHERTAVRWSAVALAVQIAGCGALIPRFGATGAAFAMAIGEAVVWWPLQRAGSTKPSEVHKAQRAFVASS